MSESQNVPVIIVRSEWLRGLCAWSNTKNISGLYVEGKRCCLGFVANACGFSDADISGLSEPSDLLGYDTDMSDKVYSSQLATMFASRATGPIYQDSRLMTDIMRTNDDPLLSEAERETIVIDILAKFGFDVSFVDTRDEVQP
jgi:hypothetical protein